MEQEKRNCQNCKKDFIIEPEDFAFYEKIQVPAPTWCPHCRMVRRMAWRNEHNLFHNKDAHSGENILSNTHPDSGLSVYENEYWWSDNWDPMHYGRDYDFGRPFLEQFRELLYAVPWPSKSVLRMVNSNYSDQASDFKNCYLSFNGNANEDCAYTFNASFNKDCFDLNLSDHNQLCYESITVSRSYKVFFSEEIEGSTDIWFSKNLVGCSNCFGCANLRKKSFCIYNEQYSQIDYFERLGTLLLHTNTEKKRLEAETRKFWLKFPVKYMLGMRNYWSTGDRLSDTKKAVSCYRVSSAENVKYCQDVYLPKTTESYDYTTWGGASRMYECLTCGEQVDLLRFCYDCWPSCTELTYCVLCHSSSNLFGCVGLKKKQYCILNKQYSKEQYSKLMAEIIEHMETKPYIDSSGRIYRYGEYFPIEFSPFAYNETVLDYLFPQKSDEATQAGFLWREQDTRNYNITIDSSELPDSITEATDAVLKDNIRCASCGRAYKIIPKELEFLKNNKLSLPRECFQCRRSRRQKNINPPVFYKRRCMKEGCQNEFETSYSSDNPDIIYCESCYQQEVI